MADKNLLFIHIPKTGGMTVNAFMEACLPPEHCATFIENADYKAKGFFLTHRYYAGHVRLSQIAPLIPREDFYIFTVLRDPAAQLMSHLAWAKSKTRDGATPDPRQWDEFYRGLFADISGVDITSAKELGDFLRRATAYRRLFDNQQTRFLLGEVRERVLNDSDCNEAIENLDAFDFIGVTEQMQDSLNAIAAANELPPPANIPMKNRNPHRGDYGLERISPAIREALAEFVRWDERVHTAAKTRKNRV